METREIGNLSEAKILAALIKAGYLVSIPFGSGHKYDFVVEDHDGLHRVQCKTGRVRNGSLLFNSYSQSGNGKTKQGYQGLADLFAVLNPETDDVYLVPVRDVGTCGACLRLVPARNGQLGNTRWASEYLLMPLVKTA
jgi:hypothetical protein